MDLLLRSCSKPSTTTAVPPLLPQLSSFGSWLAKHGPLVKSLKITSGRDAISDAAVQLLRTGLQQAAATSFVHPLAAAKPPTAAYSTTAAAAAAPEGMLTGPQQQQQQQPGLRLASFKCYEPWAVDLLPVLPAHSLTRLELGWEGSTPAAESIAAAWAAALPRLSSLQECLSALSPGACRASRKLAAAWQC